MDRLERLLRRELYKRSFYEFVKAFWNVVDTNKFVDGWLIEFYCETFQYSCRHWCPYEKIKIKLPKNINEEEVDIIDVREDKNKYNINVPPRHTKSIIFNIMGPVWAQLYKPLKAASVSHTGGLASRMNTKRQKILDDL